jgi:tRNA-binding EMAP/Myf-like protein
MKESIMELVVAEIKNIKKHPEATKLNICEVFDGTQTYQVVCGAQNARLGIKTILAKVGSVTPKGLQIKEAKLRGIDSYGMLCSARDLDVNPEDGIVDLPVNTKLGLNYKELNKDLLSSIPWHTFQLINSIYEDQQTKKLIVVEACNKNLNLNHHKLMSQTFFQNGHYIYRHFSF